MEDNEFDISNKQFKDELREPTGLEQSPSLFEFYTKEDRFYNGGPGVFAFADGIAGRPMFDAKKMWTRGQASSFKTKSHQQTLGRKCSSEKPQEMFNGLGHRDTLEGAKRKALKQEINAKDGGKDTDNLTRAFKYFSIKQSTKFRC